jgi:hypothetical protein
MFDTLKIGSISPARTCLSMLQTARFHVDRGDVLDQMIALILINSASEVAAYNMIHHVPRDSKRRRDRHKFDYATLLSSLRQDNVIDEFERFMLLFMHGVRNVLHHRGFPQGLAYSFTVPDLLRDLVECYLWLVCDLVVRLYPDPYKLTFPSSAQKQEEPLITKDCFVRLRGALSEPDWSRVSADCLLHFYAKKVVALSEMVDAIRGSRKAVHPDLLFKWHEFWLEHQDYVIQPEGNRSVQALDLGSNLSLPQNLVTPEQFKRDYANFKPRFSYRRYTAILSELTRGIDLMKADGVVNYRPKIACVLQRLDSHLEKLEDTIIGAYDAWADAIDAAIDSDLEK